MEVLKKVSLGDETDDHKITQELALFLKRMPFLAIFPNFKYVLVSLHISKLQQIQNEHLFG